MKYVNLTPHAINVDGTIYPASETVARVAVTFGPVIDGVSAQSYGSVDGLPAPASGVRYIVSALVLSACNKRPDVVAPATGHPDTTRNDKGHIISVPCFTQFA